MRVGRDEFEVTSAAEIASHDRVTPAVGRHHVYKADPQLALYTDDMSSVGDLRVSDRGQMSLPAAARRRWGLVDGGSVGYLDIGDGVLLIPGGIERLRRELLDAVSEQDWEAARAGFGDPELANE